VDPADGIEARIRTIRGRRVMLGADLAALYGVKTRALVQAVRRNADRFPSEFAFLLTKQEFADLKSQIVTSKRGGIRKPPMAFTEHGALMAATVLNSPQAIRTSVRIIRTFIRMREAVAASAEFTRRLGELERKVGTHDRSIAHIFDALRRLTGPPDSPSPTPRRRIGFL